MEVINIDKLEKYFTDIFLITGDLIWSKNNFAPFNSQIKIYKDKFFIVDFSNTLRCYSLKNGKELGAEGVQNIINSLENINPKNIVLGIEKELNWGAEKLRDDITCMAININNTELIKKKKA